MSTVLTKPVKRKVNGRIGTFIVTLIPPNLISIRQPRSRKEVVRAIDTLAVEWTQADLDRDRRKPAKKKTAKAKTVRRSSLIV